MFRCINHNWSHIEKPCPLCVPTNTYSSDSTTYIDNPVGTVSKQAYDELMQDAQELVERLEQAKIIFRGLQDPEGAVFCDLGIQKWNEKYGGSNASYS